MEWSLACPGKGIALDCWALLIEDLTGEVVAGASCVGPADSTSITFERGSTSADVAGGDFAGVDGAVPLSVQPVAGRTARKATVTAQR